MASAREIRTVDTSILFFFYPAIVYKPHESLRSKGYSDTKIALPLRSESALIVLLIKLENAIANRQLM